MNLLNIKNYIVVAFIAVAIGAWGGVEWEHNANEALAKIAMEESIVAHAEVTKKDGDVLHNAEAEKTELVTAFRTLRTEELTDNESSDCNLTVNEYDNFARLFNAASEAANARIAVKLHGGVSTDAGYQKEKVSADIVVPESLKRSGNHLSWGGRGLCAVCNQSFMSG